jgi:hypothetical protein
MPAESNAENSIPLMERDQDVEAQNGDLDKRNDDLELPLPVQTQAQTQAAARKKFLIWTAIK